MVVHDFLDLGKRRGHEAASAGLVVLKFLFTHLLRSCAQFLIQSVTTPTAKDDVIALIARQDQARRQHAFLFVSEQTMEVVVIKLTMEHQLRVGPGGLRTLRRGVAGAAKVRRGPFAGGPEAAPPLERQFKAELLLEKPGQVSGPFAQHLLQDSLQVSGQFPAQARENLGRNGEAGPVHVRRNSRESEDLAHQLLWEIADRLVEADVELLAREDG